jgi:hypothetical protein
LPRLRRTRQPGSNAGNRQRGLHCRSTCRQEIWQVIRLGERVFMKPAVRQRQPRVSSLGCANLCLDAGRKADSAALWGVNKSDAGLSQQDGTGGHHGFAHLRLL